MRKTIDLEDLSVARTLFGAGDRHLRRIRDALGINVVARKEFLHLDGAENSVDKGVRAVQGLLRIVRKSNHLDNDDVDRVLASVQNNHARGSQRHQPAVEGDELLAGRVRALSGGQDTYIEAIRSHDIVFAIGPAGSGKTYLAVAMAVDALMRNRVHRLILVRPAVEAGEHLGFLPGDLREKVNPYLRPLYDAIHDLLGPQQVTRMLEQGVIEVAPLAFMRGRTLNNAFVILDEAQNTTPKQMKMFLTRLGRDARAVVTGDITQVDLPEGDRSGLAHAQEVLKGIDDVAFVLLQRQDIVRHPLVQRIVDAYDENERSKMPLLDGMKE
ncbi:MAG: PhoH family protein [Planctomycetes bacterium]|nr:PhoH family protein [Planctomycetota bacterium]